MATGQKDEADTSRFLSVQHHGVRTSQKGAEVRSHGQPRWLWGRGEQARRVVPPGKSKGEERRREAVLHLTAVMRWPVLSPLQRSVGERSSEDK